MSTDNQFSSLYKIFSDDSIPIDQKSQLLTKFKGHVKKDYININNFQIYLDTLLLIPQKYPNFTDLIVLSYSTLCYLIKRLIIQSPDIILSDDIMDKLLNYFITNNNQFQKINKLWSLAIKTLESINQLNPIILSNHLKNILINEINRDFNRIKFILLLLNELIELNKTNKDSILLNFIPSLTKLFNDNTLFEKNQLEIICHLINDIFKRNSTNLTTLQDFINGINDKEIKSNFISDNSDNNEGNNLITVFDLNFEFNTILNEFKLPKLSNIDQIATGNDNSLIYHSLNQLNNDLTNLLLPFQTLKETEQNWKSRQSNIITIRKKFLINQKLILENKFEFISILKNLQFIDCISKTALSLRTTLSLNTCQLIKDLLTIIGDDLTISILDQLFLILKNLLSSTKKISSQVSLHILLIMFINIDFHNKLFQQCFLLISEKTIIPRNTSAILLKIFVLKFHGTNKFDNNLIYVEEWLKKGLTDAQTVVRESMRSTFWYFYKVYPTNAKNLINNSLNNNQLRKSIELSIPNHLNISYERITINSNDSSRRSSLLNSNFQIKKKFPNYAQPTHSSANNLRSVSEFSLRNNKDVADAHDNKRLKPNNEDRHTPKRKVSAPVATNFSNAGTYNNNNNYNSENFDLTDELTNPHSTSLINKYMDNHSNKTSDTKNNSQIETSEFDVNKIYASFDNDLNYKQSLQLLQNYLLQQHKNLKLDFSKISSPLRKIIIKHPLDFKQLLTITNFITSLSLSYIIELYSINNLDFMDLFSKLSLKNTQAIIDEIDKLLNELISIDNDQLISIYHMKHKFKIFNFIFEFLIALLKDSSNFEFNRILTSLFKIYGNEFENKLYFDVLFELYKRDQSVFAGTFMNFNLISTKLKIFNEFKLRDSNVNEDILNNNSSKIENDSSEDETEQDDLEMKRYMEMTMVNPFNPTKTINNNMMANDMTKTKLSDMTKVVSVYQDLSTMKGREVDYDEDETEVKNENENENNVNLSDIFNTEKENEHTVKFSNEPPKIIENNIFTSNENKQNRINNDVIEKEIIEQKKPLNSILHSTKKENPRTTFDILKEFPKDSSSFYELSILLSIYDRLDTTSQFNNMLKAFNRIKSLTFTIKHLNYLILPLITFVNENENLLLWLKENDGINEILRVCLILLKSTDENLLIPTNITKKLLILIQCLLIFNKKLENQFIISNGLLLEIWDQIFLMIDKLSDFNNEIYVTIIETRSIFIETDFFTSKTITKILQTIVMDPTYDDNDTKMQNIKTEDGYDDENIIINDKSKGLKETFLMNTIHEILRNKKSDMKFHHFQISEIVQTVAFFTNKKLNDWRYSSILVLVDSYKICQNMKDLGSQEINNIFSCLDANIFKLVKIMASNSN
ncbi:hypothetical protein KAFR_0H01130 [Kazachstania africana CBS 2517]|uniref:Protein STU1 n=1 Tax=Kazachstania africana (strain ATCC 22294 / BCRC 22015 / CBS 2517 / CECT 1963 / NBRC 1671 / NRRL Y-8276) TaxID=1071382 RepID=H2AYW7_KAZAF|nr:hypothetical protein KAFR_0H01130 [Kazachstania africana CBS 2517]CCF59523.1 hypothetical protein KAFR_0H01130 [Kazachstania africana CBS 2517]